MVALVELGAGCDDRTISVRGLTAMELRRRGSF
jgi:hypothetical protein